MDGDHPRIAATGHLTMPDAQWELARTRDRVIGRLAQRDRVGLVAADDAATELGISRRQVYVLLGRYRRGFGLVTDLVSRRSSGGKGGRRLPEAVEQIIRQMVRTRYLTRQKRSVAALHREIARACAVQGLPAPARNTVASRIAGENPVEVGRRRGGADSVRRLQSAGDDVPVIEGILDQVQIDHTVIDLIVVDERERKPIGRPYLTVAIDVCSRCLVGMVVTLEPPSAVSVGLCLAHAAQDKRPWLERIGVQAAWPMSGKPRALYVDNAREFKSEALTRGCEQHGIELGYRPPGRPHYGGIVERVIGTAMRMIHELPGTTFSNPVERGRYDSEKLAALTLPELERWLALAVASYHGTIHSTLGQTPAGRWADAVAATGLPATTANPTAFLVDFLPVVRRTLTPHRLRHRPCPLFRQRAQALDQPAREPRQVPHPARPPRHQPDLGARPRGVRLYRDPVPDVVESGGQRVGAPASAGAVAGKRAGRGRRGGLVPDDRADAPHRRDGGEDHEEDPP